MSAIPPTHPPALTHSLTHHVTDGELGGLGGHEFLPHLPHSVHELAGGAPLARPNQVSVQFYGELGAVVRAADLPAMRRTGTDGRRAGQGGGGRGAG